MQVVFFVVVFVGGIWGEGGKAKQNWCCLFVLPHCSSRTFTSYLHSLLYGNFISRNIYKWNLPSEIMITDLGYLITKTYLANNVQCTPDDWTTSVPNKSGPFMQIANISDFYVNCLQCKMLHMIHVHTYMYNN